MIFSGGLHELVMDGRKTVTRRPMQADKPCQYHEGRDYAVQPGRGKFAVGRIRVLSVRGEVLSDIDERDAVAEGFDDVAGFKEKWEALYGEADPEQGVWRLEFEVCEAGDGGAA